MADCCIEINAAANIGHIDCVKRLHSLGNSCEDIDTTLIVAGGHLGCLKYVHENGCLLHPTSCEVAADHGHLDCLKYAHENGCMLRRDALSHAENNEHYDCVRYIHENGCKMDKTFSIRAACTGRLQTLKLLCEYDVKLSKHATAIAAANGHIDCLQYLHENGCKWSEFTIRYSVRRRAGLIYAYENGANVDSIEAKNILLQMCRDKLSYLLENDPRYYLTAFPLDIRKMIWDRCSWDMLLSPSSVAKHNYAMSRNPRSSSGL